MQGHIFRPFNISDEKGRDAGEVLALTAAAMMVRRDDFFKLGGFDENFIWGYEDVDICLRCLRELGKKVKLAGDTKLIHNESTTRKNKNSFNQYIREYNLHVLNRNHGPFLLDKCSKDKDENNTADTSGTELRVAIKIPVNTEGRAENWGDTHFATALSKALTKAGCRVRIDLYPDWYKYGPF